MSIDSNLANALLWYVENDYVQEGDPGNQYYIDGLNAARRALKDYEEAKDQPVRNPDIGIAISELERLNYEIGFLDARQTPDDRLIDARDRTKNSLSALLSAPKREVVTLAADEKHDIADRHTTESRSKTDVVQDVFDELAGRFEIRRRL